ncbi:MAG TPA: hypothetical protein VF613_22545 [Longimicrobium sp.]|jgi:hypothetical protein
MHQTFAFGRTFRAAAALALVGFASACNDSTTTAEPEPDVASVRVTVGAQVVTISETGQQTGTLTLGQGTTPVTVAWLRADGSADPVVNSEDFEVRLVAQGSTGISFTPGGPFAGTLSATSAGQKVVQVQLHHLEEAHDEFGQNLTLTVQ